MMSKLFILSAVLVLGIAPHAFAQGFVPLAPIPGLTESGVANSGSFALFFNNLYKYLIGFAALLAVIEIIWGGLLISTQDSISKKGEGKEKIEMAIFGLILVLSPVLVFSIINPSILNLSLNLTKLDLYVPPYTPSITGGVPFNQLPICGPNVPGSCRVDPITNTGANLPVCGPGVAGSCRVVQTTTSTSNSSSGTTVPAVDPNAQTAGAGDCIDLNTGAAC
jgi:hypothetical protein